MKEDALVFVLILARITGIMLGCPLLSHAQLPRLWKAGLGIALTLLLGPLVSCADPGSLLARGMLPLVIMESCLGYVLGWLSCLSLQVAATVGALIDLQTGLSNASLFDPVRGEHQSLFTILFQTMASLLFLQANGPALLMQLLMLTFQLFPLGQSSQFLSYIPGVIPLGTWFFVTTLGLALPWLLTLWGLDLVIGFVGRMLPQLNLLTVGPPLKVLLAWWLTVLYFHQWLYRFEAVHEQFWKRGHW